MGAAEATTQNTNAHLTYYEYPLAISILQMLARKSSTAPLQSMMIEIGHAGMASMPANIRFLMNSREPRSSLSINSVQIRQLNLHHLRYRIGSKQLALYSIPLVSPGGIFPVQHFHVRIPDVEEVKRKTGRR